MIVNSVCDLHIAAFPHQSQSRFTLTQVLVRTNPSDVFACDVSFREVEAFEEDFVAAGTLSAFEEARIFDD